MTSIFDKLSTIDQILVGKVSSTSCGALLEIAYSESEAYKHAFISLESPEWFPLLKEKGAFEPRKEFLFQWPAQYLVKIAGAFPSEVIEIILNTDCSDRWLYRLFTEAAMNMPLPLAECWADRLFEMIETEMFDSNYYSISKLPDFTIWLAEHGSGKSIPLSSSAMEILDDKSNEKFLTRMSRYDYQQFLKKVVPYLGILDTQETIKLLSGKLNKIIDLGWLRKGASYYGDGSSFHWRPAVEDHSQNRDFYLESSIFEALRNIIESSCRNSNKLPEWLIWIESQVHPIYKRLGLHLVRLFSAQDASLITTWLIDKDLFTERIYLHEYSLLLEVGFPILEQNDKDKIQTWIREWPIDEELTEEYQERLKKRDQHRKLWFIRQYLDGSMLELFKELDKQVNLDNPEQLSFGTWMSGVRTVVGKLPIDKAKLAEKTVPDLVEYLHSEIEFDEWEGVTASALADALKEIVEAAPEKYIRDINLLMCGTLNPTYIRGMTQSFTNIYNTTKALEWELLVEWCNWVMDQQNWEGQHKEGTYTLTYADSKEHILRFISELLSSKAELTFPHILKDSVFSIFRAAFDDADPSPDRNGSLDWHSTAINSVRGVAMEAALHYALWRFRLLKENAPRSFDHTPEVRDLLEERLSAENEPSPVVRSCFGHFLPQIWWMDSKWLEENLVKIFPESEEQSAFYEAPWQTYLLYGNCYKDPFDVIKPLYERVLTSTAITEHDKDSNSHDPIDHFATHLALYYSWEKILLNEDDLLCRFMLNAHSHYRAEVLKYMGRVLEKNDDLPQEVAGRFKEFFDWWLEKINNKQPEEWHTYWWWFAYPHYEADWKFTNLNRALEVTTFEHCDGFVFEKLNSYMEDRPEQTLTTLDMYIDKIRDEDAWVLDSEDSVADILEKGHLHADKSIREQADNILSKLGSRGFLKYREIWEKPVSSVTTEIEESK